MKKLLVTLKSLFTSNINKANRALQVANCIDLVDAQQVKLAESYKKLNRVLSDIEAKRDDLASKFKTEKNELAKGVIKKNIEIMDTTLKNLKENKKRLAEKLEKSEQSRIILVAKKSLLDSIEDIKGTTSNVFEKNDFDVDVIMGEIDAEIRRIETDMKSDTELNDLVK